MPWRAIEWALGREGLSLGRVEAVGYSLDPAKRLENIRIHDEVIEGGWGSREGEDEFHRRLLTIPDRLRERGFRGRFAWLEHHRCHLASAYYPSGFERAAVLSLDGIGETASCALALGDGGDLQLLSTIDYPHSLGFLWERLCEFLGYTAYDACKVMSLAPYGNPETFRRQFEALVALTGDGGFAMDNSLLKFRAADLGRLEGLFAARARRRGEDLKDVHFDIAASLQSITNRAVLHIVGHLHERTGCADLCLAGGVFLNCMANRLACEESAFERTYIQPAANDAGTALGAAFLVREGAGAAGRDGPMAHPYWGPSFSAGQVEEALGRSSLRYHACPRIEDEVAGLIASGHVVGWFQGAMEFGPRALGNRSLLADPRDPRSAPRLNRLIKHREAFRPFAPSILAEEAPEWFEMKRRTSASDFMLVAYPAKPATRSGAPAVIHVDGTSRIQTVRRETNPRFHGLIRHFFERTGIPMVLNTSFNDNEPIVCTPDDAIRTFLGTGIDHLAIGDFLVAKARGGSSPEVEPSPGRGGCAEAGR